MHILLFLVHFLLIGWFVFSTDEIRFQLWFNFLINFFVMDVDDASDDDLDDNVWLEQYEESFNS